ncbi:MAG: hypothetical protein KZQ96_20015 [Candidatus Thiodiazotropha sp. (ex Lucinoma borealis)]|nr:hypothetical protein [Candidatus Thiodiazotropha sp. (ex Lucinoma borealis)]
MGVRVLLAHGWCFDISIWDDVIPLLKTNTCEAVDFGYFCSPHLPIISGETPLIGVGHSLGYIWLLKQRIYQIDAIINISSVPCFTDSRCGYTVIHQPGVKKAYEQLSNSPALFVKWFWRKCGASREMLENIPNCIDKNALLSGLQDIAGCSVENATKQKNIPVKVIGAKNDRVVNAMTMTRFFKNNPLVDISINESGGHLLPLLQPKWCASKINEQIEIMSN